MKRFKNILFVVENSNEMNGEASHKVRELVRLNNARLKVVGVLEDKLIDILGDTQFGDVAELKSLNEETFHEELHEALKDEIWSDIPLETEVLVGKPFISVIQQVNKYRFDLVIKQNSERLGVDNLSMRLLRKCPCPLWLIKRNNKKTPKRVLAAVDVSANDDESFELNKKIIELAHSLAQREEGEAHYLYSWFLHSESFLRGPRLKVSDKEISELKGEIALKGQVELHRIFEITNIDPAQERIHIIEGRTRPTIYQMIDDLHIDVLVMGTVGRGGIPGLLIGNTAESIVKEVKCSLMAVKPNGFISPVN